MSKTNATGATAPAANLPRLIRRAEVQHLTGLSRSGIYDLMKLGKFPRPVELGAMSVAWVESEVHDWVGNRIANMRRGGVQ